MVGGLGAMVGGWGEMAGGCGGDGWRVWGRWLEGGRRGVEGDCWRVWRGGGAWDKMVKGGGDGLRASGRWLEGGEGDGWRRDG
jgi:hypothetical protein